MATTRRTSLCGLDELQTRHLRSAAECRGRYRHRRGDRRDGSSAERAVCGGLRGELVHGVAAAVVQDTEPAAGVPRHTGRTFRKA